MDTKQHVGIVLAALILIIMNFIPEIAGLSPAGVRTICMLLAFLVMLITAPFRILHICFFFLGLMPVLGVAPTFGAALSGISNPVILFVIASFGISSAFTTLPLSRRILVALLRKFGKNVKLMLLAIMASALIISAFVSSVPTCAVFMGIALSFLELYENPDDKKRSGRTFMIAVPVATMIGAFMTPIGGTINLLALNELYVHTGATIPFVQWMAAGIPISIVTLPVAWWLIVKIHKPAEISQEMVAKFINNLDIPEKITRPEVTALVITGLMMTLWIASSWVSGINIMVVAVLGACVLCIPQLKTLKFDTFVSGIGWDSVFLIATVISLGNLMVSNGVSGFIVSILPVMNVPTPLLIAFGAALFFALLLIIPVAPSLVVIMGVPLISLAIGAGVSPAIMMLTAAIAGNACFLLPLDTVPLLTYGKGFYSIKDMFISSLPIQLFMIIGMSLWLTFIGRVFGMV
ncbi:MAG: SLC13 family permease [Oscillospiraceae bacterium]|nr:SLC13 family permease [Oscillospiraceae bacterium]